MIETKDYTGWIFANKESHYWTQVIYRVRFKLQNPIRQNHLHVVVVRDLMDFLPADAIRSLVVFTGDAEFKVGTPEGVFTLSGLVDFLSKQSTEVMSLNRVQFCVGRLETARCAISRETDLAHVERIRRKYGQGL